MTESAYFQDLAVLTVIAGLAALLFARLGWPKVLGYIAAGILMSPHTWGGSFLINPTSTQITGQLGVIFLMFGMGLSFSAKEMKEIRFVSLPCGILDTVMMIWLGYTLGVKAFGWSEVQSLFLGVAMCDSATTFLAKVFDELGWGKRPFVKYVLGTSVCEDIICVGAIAVATGVANGGGMSATAFMLSLAYLAVFFLTVLVLGFVFLPRLLKSVGRKGDTELLVLTILSALFLVSFFAYKFDFSLALGAFLVGVIGSKSEVRDRLAKLMEPMKSLFAAVFFVSIGLLVNPEALWKTLPMCLLVTAIIIVGKSLNIFVASIATGLDVKTSVQSALGLAQIGEFAFMVAILYAGLVGSSSNDMFQIAIGASLLTTILNPLLIRASGPLGDFADRKLPVRIKEALHTYHCWLEKLKTSEDVPAFLILKSAFIRLAVYAVLILSISVVCSRLSPIDYSRFSETFEHYDSIIFFILGNVLSIAFLPLVLLSARPVGDEVSLLLVGDGSARWQLAFKQSIRFFIVAAILVLFAMELTMLNLSLAPHGKFSMAIVSGVIIICAVVGWKFFRKAGSRATQRFFESLSAEERQEGLRVTTTITMPEGMIHRFTLDASSPAVGATVLSLNVRSKTGATIVSVYRDGNITRNIGPDWEFAVGDTVVVIGEHKQIVALKKLLGVTRP